MSDMTKEGTIIAIDEMITFDSGFTKREFVIKTSDDGDYPQDIKFELVKDKCAMIDKYKIGDRVTVHLNIRGREWKEKYFVNLIAWKLEGHAEQSIPAPVQGDVSSDDIPF